MTIRTTCPYRGVGCGILAKADGKGGLTVTGDPDHPANFGRLCSKGSALGETAGLAGRLLTPMIGGVAAGWDQALDLVAQKFSAAIAEHGPDAVAFYVSGQMLTEDYYVANKLMKGFIGSANIDTNSRLCMASSVSGHKRAFGSDTVPGLYEDLESADLVVLTGSNRAWCHPVLFQRLQAAKAARPAMCIVVIDPRQTATSEIADLHLALAPGSDAALFNALLVAIADHGAQDADYLTHVAGYAAALNQARASDPAMTGLSALDLRAFTDLWINRPKVVTVYFQGINQSANGTDKVNAILYCHLATGRIGKPGMGPFSVTGQPNPPDTNCRSMTDPARGLYRVAFVQDQKVVAALFIGPDPVAVSRLHLAGLPGQAAVAGVLSGRPGGTMPDPGETICACFNVGLNTIRTAIAAQGLSDLAALGRALQAGTGCGSCRVDLAALLAEPRRLEAAE